MSATTATTQPPVRYVRMKEIIFGDPTANPPIPPILPISRSTFYSLIKRGILPNGIKLTDGVTIWPLQAIIDALNQLLKIQQAYSAK